MLTLYKTMQTKMLSGTRKKFIMVLLASSGIYCDLIFIIDGQNIPTQASNTQKPSIWMEEVSDKPSSFTFDGVTKTCPSCFCYIKVWLNIRVTQCSVRPLRHTLVVMGSRREAAEIRKTICM